MHTVDSRRPSEHTGSWAGFKYCPKYDWWEHLSRWGKNQSLSMQWAQCSLSCKAKGTMTQKVRGGTGVGGQKRIISDYMKKEPVHSAPVLTITRSQRKRLEWEWREIRSPCRIKRNPVLEELKGDNSQDLRPCLNKWTKRSWADIDIFRLTVCIHKRHSAYVSHTSKWKAEKIDEDVVG